MIVQIIGNERAVWLNIGVDLTWAATVTNNHDKLTFEVHRDSELWGDDVLDERGGFVVIAHHALGVWRGVADTPRYIASTHSLRFQAIPFTQWLDKNHVGPNQTFRSALAGHVLQAAFRDGIDGRVPLKLGSVLFAPPFVDITFKRQPILDVLIELNEKTNHEFWIDDDLALNWGVWQGRFHERIIIDDGSLLQQIESGSLLDRANQVIEIEPDGGEFIAYDGNVPITWPSQRIERL